MEHTKPVADPAMPSQMSMEYLRTRAEAAIARRDSEISRLRAEIECLRIIEQRFEALVEQAPIWLFACGSDGAVTFMNSGFTRFTGKPAEAALGAGWLDFVHPGDIKAVRKAIGTALTTGVAEPVTMRVRAADGSYARYVAHGNAVRDRNKKIVEWYGALSPA